MTAAELLDALSRDEVHKARVQERDARINAASARYEKEERPLVEALGRAGVLVDSVWDLVNSSAEYPAALPVLLEHLGRPYAQRVREGIARALAVPWAPRDAARALVVAYRNTDPRLAELRWALANALEVVASVQVFDDLVALARQPDGGPARQMLVLAIAKTGAASAPDTLMQMLSDGEVAGHAVSGLARLKANVPKALLEPFLDHAAAWVRRDARKLLARGR